MSLYRPTSSAVSPAGPGHRPDGPAGRRAIPVMRRTSIQNTSSAGLPKWFGRPPDGPAPGPVSPGRPPNDLQELEKAWKIIKTRCDMYQ
jgi:hypothetical protein